MPSPPSSPSTAAGEEAMMPREAPEMMMLAQDEPEEAMGPDESAIAREFMGEEEIGAFMNQMMQQTLKRTGLDKRMKNLPMSEQQAIADRIKTAQDGMLQKIMEETDQMESGEKVVTADVVRRCMAQMGGMY